MADESGQRVLRARELYSILRCDGEEDGAQNDFAGGR
jgi:hypothetical protein